VHGIFLLFHAFLIQIHLYLLKVASSGCGVGFHIPIDKLSWLRDTVFLIILTTLEPETV